MIKEKIIHRWTYCDVKYKLIKGKSGFYSVEKDKVVRTNDVINDIIQAFGKFVNKTKGKK